MPDTLYDCGSTDSLYGEKPQQKPQSASSANPQASGNAPTPADAFNAAVALVENPIGELAAEAFPDDPAQSKFPLGIAIVGSAIVFLLWVNSWDQGK